MSTPIFTIEEFEFLRLTMGEKIKQIDGKTKNYTLDPKITEDKKQMLIDYADFEKTMAINIEAKVMREISKHILD